jgi:hypothetical protein
MQRLPQRGLPCEHNVHEFGRSSFKVRQQPNGFERRSFKVLCLVDHNENLSPGACLFCQQIPQFVVQRNLIVKWFPQVKVGSNITKQVMGVALCLKDEGSAGAVTILRENF